MSFPVRSIDEARSFYGGVLGWEEGRSHKNWIDYSCFGHQVVCHWVGNDFKAIDYHNPVDGDEVPVPHFGVCMEVDQFHEFAQKVKDAGIPFVIEPHLR